MPERKKPSSLQSLALRRIGQLFSSTCQDITKEVIHCLNQDYAYLSFAQLKAKKSTLLCDSITQIQNCFFVDTAYYFHERIFLECLVALSDLLESVEADHEITAYISPVPAINNEPQLPIRMKKEILLDFLDIFCFPGSRIKIIDISIDKLGPRWKINKSVITGLSDRLIFMPFIEEINFGHWSCRNLSLLSDHNHFDGFALEYLKHLKVLKLHDVSQKLFQSVGTYCPQLRKLHIYASDITDTVTWWVSKCKLLETVELFDDKDVTPVGYAQLLRANPQLKSLGKCDCFGKVLYTLYDNSSMYRRSYSNLPEHLNLEEVDTNGQLNHEELKLLAERCPSLKKLRFKYSRQTVVNENNTDQDHLAKLITLDHLTQLSISRANFFEHYIFQLLELRGNQIVHLELIDIDEVNLNSILMLGAHCLNLRKFCLHGCHFQMHPEDAATVDAICHSKHEPSGKPKRLRLTSTSSSAVIELHPFENLKSLDVYLTSPAHLPIFQYLVNQATRLETLIFDQFFSDYSESLINRSLFDWSSLEHLKELHIGHGSQLSIVTVNVILANCNKLVKLGKLDRWGQVTRQQISSIRNEVQARNFDLILDAEE